MKKFITTIFMGIGLYIIGTHSNIWVEAGVALITVSLMIYSNANS